MRNVDKEWVGGFTATHQHHNIEDKMALTKAQQLKLREIWCKPGTEGFTYLQFRRTVQQGAFLDNVCMVPWCGMWIGIEPDGHAHT